MCPGTLWIIELLAQPRDVHIHGPRIDFAVVLPPFLKNFFARQYAIAVQHQILQQPQFFCGQGYPAAGATNFGALKVDFHVIEREGFRRSTVSFFDAPNQGFDARQQFGRIKRLV
jgi:hypothetical protein